MILRSLTKHVKDQNWFAVWMDFLIVVLGVFIGIQVSNWNIERDNNATKARYVEFFLEDLGVDKRQLEVTVSLVRRKISAINFILESSVEIEPQWTTRRLPKFSVQPSDRVVFQQSESDDIWRSATFTYRADTSTTALESLLSAEGLKLLDSPGLARALQNYAARGLELTNITENLALLDIELVSVFVSAGLPSVSIEEMDFVASLIRAEPAVQAGLKTLREAQLVYCAVLELHLQRAERLIHMFELFQSEQNATIAQ